MKFVPFFKECDVYLKFIYSKGSKQTSSPLIVEYELKWWCCWKKGLQWSLP